VRPPTLIRTDTAPSALTATLALGLTQIIGWGTTFSPLMALGDTLTTELMLPREVIFAGITAMLVFGALAAPSCGRAVDRYGSRPIMAAGSILVSAALLLLAAASGMVTYLLAWTLIGLASPMMLTNAALPGLVQITGGNARRGITILTLLTGFTSTIFLPPIAYLNDVIGWRTTFLGFAILHLAVCLPIHLLVLPRTPPSREQGVAGGTTAPWEGRLPTDKRRLAFVLLALWSCTDGIIVWGLNMQIIDVFQMLGLSATAAIGVWMLSGPTQAASRFEDLLTGGRLPILKVAMSGAAVAPLGILAVLTGGATIVTAGLLAITYGIAHGLFALARNMLPLLLFGQKEYGTYMGRLMLPQNLANAASPIVFAAIITRSGADAALWAGLAMTLTGLAGVLILIRVCQDAAA
jgi:MFS family permease